MTTPEPPWVVEGGTVAVYITDTVAPPAVKKRAIARLTTTLIVLDDDTRWRRKDRKPVGRQGDVWATREEELLTFGDPRVVNARAGIVLRNVGRAVAPLLSGPRTVTDVAGALDALTRAERVLTAARRHLAALPTSMEADHARDDHAE